MADAGQEFPTRTDLKLAIKVGVVMNGVFSLEIYWQYSF